MKKTLFTIIALSLIFLTALAGAGEKEFKIALSNETASPGRQVTLALVFEGVDYMPPLELPFIEGLDIKFKQGAQGTETLDGKQVKVFIYTYIIVGFAEGDYEIGPIACEYKGDLYRSNSTVLTVSKSAKRTEVDKTVSGEKKGISERMFLEIELPDRDIHVNEKVPVTVKFYTDWLDVSDLRIADVPSKNYITEDYEAKPTTVVEKNGVQYAVLRFDKSFFVSVPGDFVFGPVKARFYITKAQGDLLNQNEAFYNEYLGRKRRKEVTLEKGPFDIKVISVKKPEKVDKKPEPAQKEAGKKEIAEETEKEKSQEMLVQLKKSPGRADHGDNYFFRRRWFAIFEMLPLLFIPLAVILKRRRDMTAPDTPYGRLLRASKKAERGLQVSKKHLRQNDPFEFYRQLFTSLQEYIGIRCDMEPGGITEDIVERMLKDKIKDDEVFEYIYKIYSDCYFARYTELEIDKKDMLSTYKLAAKLIKRLNKEKVL